MSDINASQQAIELANANNIDLATITGTGRDGFIRKGDVEAAIQQPLAASDQPSAAEPAAAAESPKPSAESESDRHEPLTIQMRKGGVFCGRTMNVGDVIATVQLEEGVSLNFLVDAIRNDMARDTLPRR